ncbi:hypothetical protein FQA39_LY00095 [Lamprigera yunnana]|nr:hypothetical protein FQA39_LY00095 [Lamprigera yunnana]
MGGNVNTNYRKIEKEAPNLYSSKNEHPKIFVQELQALLNKIKKQIRDQYVQAMEDAIIREAMKEETESWVWGIKEESVIKSELYGSKFSLSLGIHRDEYALNVIHLFKQLQEEIDERTIVYILAGQLEVEIQNKVMMDETEKFEELLRILKAQDQCEKEIEKDYERKYNQQGQYNNYT